MKKITFTILVFSLVLSGCSLTGNDDAKKDDPKTGLANPASTFCVEQGGELEMRENEDGQYGVCKFPDGSECDEWAFYRLECKPGDESEVRSEEEEEKKDSSDKIEQDKSINSEKDVKTGNDNITVIGIEANDNITSPVTIKGEGVAFENNLIVELRNKDHETLVKENTTIKSNEVGESGPFEITLNFEFTNTKEGYIAVYEQSAKDGSEQNLVEIPVRFNYEESEENLVISYNIDEIGLQIKYSNIDCHGSSRIYKDLNSFCDNKFGKNITKDNLIFEFSEVDGSEMEFVDSWPKQEYYISSITDLTKEESEKYNSEYDDYVRNLDKVYRISLKLKDVNEDFQEISRLYLTKNSKNLSEKEVKYWSYCEAGCPLFPEELWGDYIVWEHNFNRSSGAGDMCGWGPEKRNYSGDDDKMCEAYLNMLWIIDYKIN